VVGIFKTRVGFNGWRRLELRLEFLRIEKGPLIQELATVRPISDDACAMGKHLSYGYLRNRGMQVVDISPHGIIES
jgi:hypothetical protein